MIKENKVSKYMLYAIGEIVLVMIGILLALQVNQWNENRKQVSLQVSVLKDIQSDLRVNIFNLETGISNLELMRANNLEVISLFENQTPYHDSKLKFFTNFLNYWDPDFTYAGFENLKSQGVNLISNPVLRKDIINLIEVEMTILDQSEMSRIDQISIVMTMPILKKYFYRNLTENLEYLPFMPSNYQAMMADQEFYNVCTEMAYRQLRGQLRFAKFNKKAASLIAQMNKEIETLEQ